MEKICLLKNRIIKLSCKIKWSVKHPNKICSDFLLKISFAEHSWESCMIQHNWSEVLGKTDYFFYLYSKQCQQANCGCVPIFSCTRKTRSVSKQFGSVNISFTGWPYHIDDNNISVGETQKISCFFSLNFALKLNYSIYTTLSRIHSFLTS